MALPLIKVVQLTLTNRCQCNCMHCGVSKLRQSVKGELTIDQIEMLFQDFELAGCLVVDLFGGEPTLRRDLLDIIARGKSHGFIVSLETNGYAIDQSYASRLAASGLDRIYLSLDDFRPDRHDQIRRKKGSFDRAVRALELCAGKGIEMHVSTVPQTSGFFTNGDINRFMHFVLERGAEKVRLLLPRFVGDSIHEDDGPLYAGEEKEMFSYVSSRYYDYIYLHTPGTPLGEKNLCTAKQVFCHLMSNGWVAPCPYFPLVFGDATREPIIDVFERIQSHPLIRLGGDFCPMRNEEYIDAHMRDLGIDRPFFPIEVENQIDIGSTCRAECPGCAYGTRHVIRPIDEILLEIETVPPEYTRIEFYGGDAFLRNDLFDILDHVPSGKRIVLWSECERGIRNLSFVKRLRSYPIESLKIRLSSSEWGVFEESTRLKGILQRLSLLGPLGLTIHLYVPLDIMRRFKAFFARNIQYLGVERLYVFTRDPDRPLVNSVGCFGRELGMFRILWVNQRM